MLKVFRRGGRGALLAATLAILLCTGAGRARADSWWAGAGWARSDTGLQEDGDGLWAQVEGERGLGAGPLALGYSLSYIQKLGSVRMVFSDPVEGNRLGDAEVTLHTLRTALTLGPAYGLGPLRVRLFAGAGADLKVSEQWDQPTGGTDRQYGYEDTDLVLLAGLNLRTGAWRLDIAYDAGLRDQVIVEGVVEPTKGSLAIDPLDGASLPGSGGNVDTWRLGLGYRFSGP